jgi:hypothetical protein
MSPPASSVVDLPVIRCAHHLESREGYGSSSWYYRAGEGDRGMRRTNRASRAAAVTAALAWAASAALAGCTATTEPGGSSGGGSGSGGGAAEATTLPGLPDAERARDLLAGLTVAEPRPMTGYSRDRFPHWTSADGCTVRQTVLRRDGHDVRVDDDCQPVSGTWTSPYDGTTLTHPGDVDIDHVVPLANAWRSGADTWSEAEREAFANDLTRPQLLAVSARANREKGDQSPDDWQPPEAFHCVYARAWTAVKDAYGLSVTATERDALSAMLDTCP